MGGTWGGASLPPGRGCPALGTSRELGGEGLEQAAGERCVCGQGKLKAKEVWWNNVDGDGMGAQHLQTFPEAEPRQQKAPVR